MIWFLLLVPVVLFVAAGFSSNKDILSLYSSKPINSSVSITCSQQFPFIPNSINNITRGLSEISPYATDLFNSHPISTSDYNDFVGADANSLFAVSVSNSENFAIVGASGHNMFEGIVHIYTLSVGACSWTLQTSIRNPAVRNDNFGSSVAIDELNLVIGANLKDSFTGVAYVYQFVNNNFWYRSAVIPSPMGMYEGFGSKVAISGNYTIIATGRNDAFIYENRGDSWSLSVSLSSIVQVKDGDMFGCSVAIYGEYAVVGSRTYNVSQGAVYIFKVNSSDPSHPWSLFQTLTSVHGFNTFYGHSVDIDETTLIVGAVGLERGETFVGNATNNTGWVHVYDLSADKTSFTLSQSIAPIAGRNSYFGSSIKIKDVEMVVGASGYLNNSGAAFVYRRNYTEFNGTTTSQWELRVALPSTSGTDGNFGHSVGISRTHVTVGAFSADNLRGGGSILCRSVWAPVTSSPTFRPTALPTMLPTAETNSSRNNAGGAGQVTQKMTWGTILAMIIGFLLSVLICYFLYRLYNACYPAAQEVEELKKEEEEDSPYTVHGPGSDFNDDDSGYSNEFLSSYDQWTADYDDQTSYFSDSMYTHDRDGQENTDKKKDKKSEKEKKNKDGSLSVGVSKCKVHSYAGYREEDYPEHQGEEASPGEKMEKLEADYFANRKEKMAAMDRSPKSSNQFEDSSSIKSVDPVFSRSESPPLTICTDDSSPRKVSGSRHGNHERIKQSPLLSGRRKSPKNPLSTYERSEILVKPVAKIFTFSSAGGQRIDSFSPRSDHAAASLESTRSFSEHNSSFVSSSDGDGDGDDSTAAATGIQTQVSNSTRGTAMSNAQTSYAMYKQRMAEMEQARINQTAQMRADMERLRLADETQLTSNQVPVHDDVHNERNEVLRQAELEQECFDKATAIVAARAKSQEFANRRFAQFKALQAEQTRLRAEEEMKARSALNRQTEREGSDSR